MQLILIVQVSIALLVEELAGSLGLSVGVGAALLALAPTLVVLNGVILGRMAQRSMDRASRRGVELLFRVNGMVGWPVTVLLVLAAGSDLPLALEPHAGMLGVSALLVSVGVVSTLLVYATTWPVERRIRESALVGGLDAERPLHAMPARGAYVLAQARAGLLPMLAPLVVPVVLSEVARSVAVRFDPAYEEGARLAGGVSGAVLLFVLVPLIVPPLLGLRRLAPGPMRDDLEELARDAGVGVREIWVWPTDGLVANAAVMGVLPGMRCVMLSDCLLESMPREQVRAVMAHELGHVVRRHLPWMIAVVLACWTLASAAVTPIAQALYERIAVQSPDDAQASILHGAALARDGAVLALGLIAFGFASRRFERQADTYAIQLLSSRASSARVTSESVDSMAGALGSVALLNHVPRERSSWRHGSIAWRQEYLHRLAGLDHRELAIDTLVAAMRWGSLAIVLAGVVLHAAVD